MSHDYDAAREEFEFMSLDVFDTMLRFLDAQAEHYRKLAEIARAVRDERTPPPPSPLGLCDLCKDAPATHEVRMPRLSDPTDLCCVEVVCLACTPGGASNEMVRTPDEWVEYIESNAARFRKHEVLS